MSESNQMNQSTRNFLFLLSLWMSESKKQKFPHRVVTHPVYPFYSFVFVCADGSCVIYIVHMYTLNVRNFFQ